jgi:DNA replication protein DnaC
MEDDIPRVYTEDFLKIIGVPVRYHEARISDFIGEVPGMNDQGMFITGTPGVGKTHMAAALVVELLSEFCIKQMVYSWLRDEPKRLLCEKIGSCGIAWGNVPELLDSLRRGIRKEAGGVSMESLAEISLLVLDDLGAEKQTEWTAQSLYVLVNKRIDNLKLTIITTNLSLTDFEELDPRLASRLGSLRYHSMEGEDRRISDGHVD